MATNPFDFVSSVNFTKRHLIKEGEADEKSYLPFMVNTALSYFPDTVEYANIMNMNYHLDNKLQYDYLFHIVRPKKRFSKWVKKETDTILLAISKYYKCNITRAKEYKSILTGDEINHILLVLESCS
jgi:hypothetical protein